ncbi:hypothetical protein LTR78_009002 [Recurvomyces mirabilis]|uniref:Uncharacterized protein n=1 Tax=Recurvomyces mirabilis TaxID=574656 RepID=A0AAE0TU21_9PEZI|nr:hypothetical protein LTR78_009002 [Recurvomyces mirabilis]KAK5150470.1 hypothetical protein LTS14_010160 [Recurvomyces mirabilis]
MSLTSVKERKVSSNLDRLGLWQNALETRMRPYRGRKSARNFWKQEMLGAISSLPYPGQRLHIPSDSFIVEAIWYAPNHDTIKLSTLILGNGYDGSQGVLYHTVVVPALASG